MNATLSSALSSPLESPDIMQTFLPFCDIGAATTSMASIKLSADSINNKSQQVRHIRLASFSNSTSTSNHNSASSASIPHDTNFGYSGCGTIMPHSTATLQQQLPNTNRIMPNDERTVRFGREYHHGYAIGSKPKPLVEFSISSVGRSFIDEMEENDGSITNISLKTPDTPTTPNISPSSSNRFSDDLTSLTFFDNSVRRQRSPNAIASPISDRPPLPLASSTSEAAAKYTGSWDLLELDFFHDNPSYGGDVEEKEFLGDDVDDPLGILPPRPTPPDTLKL